MKYNILTVANETYKPFLKVFLESLIDNADSDNLQNIYVFNTGLRQDTVAGLSMHYKIQFIPTSIKAESEEIHDHGWKVNTYSKTRFLVDALKSQQIPTFMIDNDCVFQSNFEDLIEWDKDIVACYRGPDHPICNYLGSFFGAINIPKSILFIKIWIQQIQLLQFLGELTKLEIETGRAQEKLGCVTLQSKDVPCQLKHCESPSLTKCVEIFDEFNCQSIEEDLISCVKTSDDARIYHLKSDGFAQSIDERLELHYAKHLVDKYV